MIQAKDRPDMGGWSPGPMADYLWRLLQAGPMLTFYDGPAVGVVLMCRRAPLFLRVVRHAQTWDALDQLSDQQAPREEIIVYRRLGQPGRMHLNMGRRGGCRWEQTAGYRLYEHPPDDATARDTAAWRAWCQAEAQMTYGYCPRCGQLQAWSKSLTQRPACPRCGVSGPQAGPMKEDTSC